MTTLCQRPDSRRAELRQEPSKRTHSTRPLTRLGSPGDADPEDRTSRPVLQALRLVVVLLLAGWLLVAHGCHGDEDNELWARVQVWLLGGK